MLLACLTVESTGGTVSPGLTLYTYTIILLRRCCRQGSSRFRSIGVEAAVEHWRRGVEASAETGVLNVLNHRDTFVSCLN